MNEIKKCPFCEQDACVEISVNDGYVKALVMCKGCGVRYETVVPLNKYSHISIVVEYAFSVVLEQWNKRTEEPHKESRVEQILKRTIFPNKPFCTLAYNDKHGKGCKDLDCCECEFNNVTETAKYLLAPHED